MRERLYLSLLISVLLCLAGWTAHAQMSKSARVTWEYRVIEYRYAYFDEEGAKGWELVAVSDDKCYFKRAK